ncbi:MAG: GspH/FimT family pseudopilin [Pseudomonadota bacterium]
MQRGLTLIELIVTMALMALILGMAIPVSRNIMASSELTATANAMVGVLNEARVQGIRRNRTVWISPGVGSNGVTEWQNGIHATVGAPQEFLDQTVFLRAVGGIDDRLRVTVDGADTTQDAFGFSPEGFLVNADRVDFVLCNSVAPSNSRRVRINLGGQIETTDIQRDECDAS